MGERHCLGRVSDEITGNKGVFHTHVSHGDAVANRNCGKYYGSTACHRHAELYGIYDLIEIHVSGDDLVIGADDTDQGAFLFFLGESQGVK